MAAAPDRPQFANFKEAFCAYYRCKPERFEAKAFWKSLHRLAVLPAIPIYLFNRRFFHQDFDAIRQFGAARNSDEFSNVTDELGTMNRLERSIRRGVLRIRISGTRLLRLHDLLVPYVRSQQAEKITHVPKAAAIDVMPGRNESATREGSALVLRKLRQVHDEVTSGRPLAEALTAVEYTEDTLLDVLTKNSASNPEFAWLRDHLQHRRRLEELEAENSFLTKKLIAQEREIEKLKERLLTDAVKE